MNRDQEQDQHLLSGVLAAVEEFAEVDGASSDPAHKSHHGEKSTKDGERSEGGPLHRLVACALDRKVHSYIIFLVETVAIVGLLVTACLLQDNAEEEMKQCRRKSVPDCTNKCTSDSEARGFNCRYHDGDTSDIIGLQPIYAQCVNMTNSSMSLDCELGPDSSNAICRKYVQCERECNPSVFTGNTTRSVHLACMGGAAGIKTWLGAPLWRWLAFFAAYPALKFIIWVVMPVWMDVIKLEAGKEYPGVYVEVSELHDELVVCLRYVLWLVTWLAVMNDPKQAADSAIKWRKLGAVETWAADFADVYNHVWKALLVVALWATLWLGRAIVAQLLLKQFHQLGRRLNQLSRVIVDEHVLRAVANHVTDHEQSGAVHAECTALEMAEKYVSETSWCNQMSGAANASVRRKCEARMQQAQMELQMCLQLRGCSPETPQQQQQQQLPLFEVIPFAGRLTRSLPLETPTSAENRGHSISSLTADTYRRVVSMGSRSNMKRSSKLIVHALRSTARQCSVTVEALSVLNLLAVTDEKYPWSPLAHGIAEALHRIQRKRTRAVTRCCCCVASSLKPKKIPKSIQRKLQGELMVTHLRLHPFIEDLSGKGHIKNRGQARQLGFTLFWHLLDFFQNLPDDEAASIVSIPMLLRGFRASAATRQAAEAQHPEQAKGNWEAAVGDAEHQAQETDPQSSRYEPRLFHNEAALKALVGPHHVHSLWEMLAGATEESPEAAAAVSEMRASLTVLDVMDAMEQVYERRKALSLTLIESSTIIIQMRRVASGTIFVILAFIAPALWFPEEVKELVMALSALLVSITFIFGSTAGQLFDNSAFLLFTHPFDYGDVIRINDGEEYIVNELASAVVCLLRVRDEAVIRVPTQTLREAEIHNVTQSRIRKQSKSAQSGLGDRKPTAPAPSRQVPSPDNNGEPPTDTLEQAPQAGTRLRGSVGRQQAALPGLSVAVL